MQQTRLDRWIRERFVYETHVYAMRPATQVPRRIRSEELPDAPGRQYRMRYVARRSGDAEKLIARLKADHQMFTTRILDRPTWYAPLLAPPGKSFTWVLVWAVSGISGALYGVSWILRAWSNPEIRQQVAEALEILKN